MSRKPKVWELPEDFDPQKAENIVSLGAIEDDILYWPQSKLATNANYIYRLHRYASISKKRTILQDNPFDYFSDVIDDCKRLGICLRIGLKITDGVVRKFPFFEKHWQEAEIIYEKGEVFGFVSFFGPFYNMLYMTGKILVDESFQKNVLLKYWKTLEKTTTYIMCVPRDLISIHTDVFMNAGIRQVLCKSIKVETKLNFGEETFVFQPGFELMDFTFAKSKTSKFQKLLDETELIKFKPIHIFDDKLPYIYKENRTNLKMGICNSGEKTQISKIRHKVFLELVTVMYALCNAPYVVLEILDWIPFIYQQNHVQKINLIYSIFKSIKKIHEQRTINKVTKI